MKCARVRPWASPGAARALSSVLVVSATVSLAAATGCGAQEPARAASAQAGVGVSTPKTYWAKIQAARPGDVIVLGDGDYGTLDLNGKSFAEPGIRIEAKPGAKAVFNSLSFQGSEGIEVRGMEVAVPSNAYGVNVQHSSRIRLSGLNIHALGAELPNAAMLRDSHDLSLTDSDIHEVGTGVNFLESNHVKISGNRFTNVQSDAIRGAGSYIEVVGNSGSSFRPAEGDHPDFIQFWGSSTGVATGNVIKDNVFERGAGAVVQGIFIENNENIAITGNAMAGTMYNGISLSGIKGALIADNFVQGYTDMGTRIIVRGASADVTIRDNVAESIVNLESEGQNPRYKEVHNTSIRPAKPGDTAAMKAWIAQHKAH
ncbi:MAG: hypothetical protein JWP23_1645 [Phenylobacterium sp.]|nr:hypothetical protein [Phenylobacterium sp.]